MNPAITRCVSGLGQKKRNEIPLFARDQVDAFSRDLAAVASDWPVAGTRDLRFDPEWTAFAAAHSGNTHAALFGSRLFRSGKWAARLARTRDFRPLLDPRLHFRAKVDLPRDAVILLLFEGKKGIVMASEKAGLLAKLRYGDEGVREWRREIEATKALSATDAGAHVPPIVSHGMEPGGCAWIVMRLAPNRHPILPNLFRGDRRFLSERWRLFLRRRILPVMESVCAHAGIDEISADDYAQSVCEELPPDPPVQRLFRKMDAAYSPRIGRAPVLVSRIHGDLCARHVHRSGGRWWLLDWGESARRELFLEHLNHHIRRPASYSRESQRFWNWLGRGGELSGEFGAYASLFAKWIRDWTGHGISPEALRFQILAYLLKRVKEERAADLEPAFPRSDALPARPGVANADTIFADLSIGHRT